MKRTAMQELIEEMEKSPLMYANAIELAEAMLEKEKEVMERVYYDSFVNSNGNRLSYDFEEYYNETFNTKEK
jgi:hypothetical protein